MALPHAAFIIGGGGCLTRPTHRRLLHLVWPAPHGAGRSIGSGPPHRQPATARGRYAGSGRPRRYSALVRPQGRPDTEVQMRGPALSASCGPILARRARGWRLPIAARLRRAHRPGSPGSDCPWWRLQSEGRSVPTGFHWPAQGVRSPPPIAAHLPPPTEGPPKLPLPRVLPQCTPARCIVRPWPHSLRAHTHCHAM